MVTTITKTIKPSGGDYSQPQDAYDDIPAIVGSADLVAADSAVEFLMDSGAYEPFDCNLTDGLTTDATRNVTFKAADGQDHAGSVNGGVRIEVAEGGTQPAVTVRQDHCAFEGLTVVARQGANGNYGFWCLNSEGNIIKRCIVIADGQYSILMQSNATALSAVSVIENVLAIGDGTADDRYIDLRGSTSATGRVLYRMVNCSGFDSNAFIRVGASGASGSVVSVEMHNNFAGNCTRAYQTSGSATLSVTGGGNVGGSTNPFPEAIQAKDQTWDITADQAAAADGNTAIFNRGTLKLTSSYRNDALEVGTGPDSDSDVPTVDIAGLERRGTTTNPGAFQSLTHVWTPMTSQYAKRVDTQGILRLGTGYFGAKVDTLSFTNNGNDTTAVIPAGTTALWFQIESQASGQESTEVDVKLLIDSSTTVTLMKIGGGANDSSTALGMYYLPVEITKVDASYPKFRMQGTDASQGAVTARVIAIGPEGPTWS